MFVYFKNSEGKIYYEVHGEENRPVIVFSHGVAMDHQTFQKQVDYLKRSFRIVIWDLPFHGKSQPLTNKAPFTETSAYLIVELLNKLNIRKAVFIGQSLGSFITQHIEHKYPERVIATIHIGGGPLHPRYSKLLNLFKPFLSCFLMLYPKKMLYRHFGQHKALTKDTQMYLEKTASVTGKKVISQLTIEMLSDMTSGLPELGKKPTLILYGDHDVAFIKNNCIKWHDQHSNSQLFVIKDAHHITNQDQPDAVNEQILLFFCTIFPDLNDQKSKGEDCGKQVFLG